MDNLTITERYNQDVTILDLTGKIRLGESIVNLRTALRVVTEEGKTNILLNLAAVSHIDSSGLGELVAGYTSMQKNGGELKLLHLNYRVREIMLMTKLLTIFDVFEDEEEAVLSFKIHTDTYVKKQSEIITGQLDENLATI